MNQIRTVQQLRHYLNENKLSPESFAKKVRISNMTLRRLLKRKDLDPIPARYHVQMDHALMAEWIGLDETSGQFQALLTKIEAKGTSHGGGNLGILEENLKNKFGLTQVDPQVKEKAQSLFGRLPKLPVQSKALAVGALLYFLDPMDLIPDLTPIIGFIDDFGVLSLVLDRIDRSV